MIASENSFSKMKDIVNGHHQLVVAPPGWTAEVRNVRVFRLSADSPEWIIEPLPNTETETKWRKIIFECEAPRARLHIADGVVLTQRIGIVAQIERSVA